VVLGKILAVAPPGMTLNGIAPTLEEAKQKFAVAWRRYTN
jgi:hypothetical protein